MNTGVSEDATQGKAVFSLSLDNVAGRGDGTAGLDGLATRIRKATAKVCASRGFIGIPSEVSATGGKESLMDLFVPLDFEPREARGRDDEKIRTELAEIETRLHAKRAPGKPAPRYAVLGGPGSGKSTLVQYLAVSTASHKSGLVPVRVVLRERPIEDTDRMQPRVCLLHRTAGPGKGAVPAGGGGPRGGGPTRGPGIQ